MGEQKNLFLAIGLSIAIILVFQLLFPQTNTNVDTSSNFSEEIQPANSIDDNSNIVVDKIKSKEEILGLSKRVTIDTPSLSGSINLEGAILDDLILSKYNQNLNDNSKKISLSSI